MTLEAWRELVNSHGQAAGELVEFILSSGRAREFHLQV
jgi:hypothetical protein